MKGAAVYAALPGESLLQTHGTSNESCWSEQPLQGPSPGGVPLQGETEVLSGRELFTSLLSAGSLTVFSLPALIGSWCWPAVLAGAIGGTFEHLDTSGGRRLAHTISWGVNLAAFCSMLTFVAAKTPGKRGHLPRWRCWAPFLGMLLASLLVMVDPTRHIMLDAGMYVSTLHMFNRDGSLTPAGKFGQASAWVGNALLILSLIWFVLPASSNWLPVRTAGAVKDGDSSPI